MKGRNAKLDPKAQLVARKLVKLNGRSYQIGDPINDSTIAFRVKEKLYRVGVITTVEDYELYRNKYGRVVPAEQEVVEDEKPSEEVAEAQEDAAEEVVEEASTEKEEESAEQPAAVEAKADAGKENKKRRGRPRTRGL